ncbi:hypothetical protein GCM10009629_40680 [Pseudonocardia alni]
MAKPISVPGAGIDGHVGLAAGVWVGAVRTEEEAHISDGVARGGAPCGGSGTGQQRVRDAFGQFVVCVPPFGHAEHDLQWENQSPQDGHHPYDRAALSRPAEVALALSLVSVRTAAVGITALLGRSDGTGSGWAVRGVPADVVRWPGRAGACRRVTGWARRAPGPPRWVMARQVSRTSTAALAPSPRQARSGRGRAV